MGMHGRFCKKRYGTDVQAMRVSLTQRAISIDLEGPTLGRNAPLQALNELRGTALKEVIFVGVQLCESQEGPCAFTGMRRCVVLLEMVNLSQQVWEVGLRQQCDVLRRVDLRILRYDVRGA